MFNTDLKHNADGTLKSNQIVGWTWEWFGNLGNQQDFATYGNRWLRSIGNVPPDISDSVRNIQPLVSSSINLDDASSANQAIIDAILVAISMCNLKYPKDISQLFSAFELDLVSNNTQFMFEQHLDLAEVYKTAFDFIVYYNVPVPAVFKDALISAIVDVYNEDPECIIEYFSFNEMHLISLMGQHLQASNVQVEDLLKSAFNLICQIKPISLFGA